MKVVVVEEDVHRCDYVFRSLYDGEKRGLPTLISTTVSMSATPSAPSPPTRSLAARKRPSDPTWFSSAQSVPSTKRQATDRMENEQRKRKRVEPTLQGPSQPVQERQNEEPPVVSVALLLGGHINDERVNGIIIPRQMDFTTLPMDALHRYLVQYDLIPTVHPSPLTIHDPPPPPSLLEPAAQISSRGVSPLVVATPANRPRRESSRRRSSRMLEEEERMRTPVLADVGEVQNVLASIAQQHFESQVVKEVDSLASFMCAVKGRGEPDSLFDQKDTKVDNVDWQRLHLTIQSH